MTIVGTTPGDDRSLRISCIHYVLMLCSGSLFKGVLNVPLFPIWNPLPREGRTKDVMQVLSISTNDYLRNTCLHYIDELELVLCHPML